LDKARKQIGRQIDKTSQAVQENLGLSKQGCLKRGDESDPYILTDAETGEEITVIGSGDLARHVDHMVRVRGQRESDGRVFQVTEIEQIASSCDATPPTQALTGPAPSHDQVTVSDQGINADDRKLTQAIRRALVRDDALSTYGKNVKIISRNGFVTLKGLVRSDEERQRIESKAVGMAGAGNVSNDLMVQARGSTQMGDRGSN
jgi:hypothetical protein